MKWTESMVLDIVGANFGELDFTGERYLFLRHVRNATGHASRVIDGLALHLWASDHFEMRAFEVKVRRGDFLKELKSQKYRSSLELYGSLYFAAPEGLIDRAEVPDGCGLVEVSVHRATVEDVLVEDAMMYGGSLADVIDYVRSERFYYLVKRLGGRPYMNYVKKVEPRKEQPVPAISVAAIVRKAAATCRHC